MELVIKEEWTHLAYWENMLDPTLLGGPSVVAYKHQCGHSCVDKTHMWAALLKGGGVDTILSPLLIRGHYGLRGVDYSV